MDPACAENRVIDFPGKPNYFSSSSSSAKAPKLDFAYLRITRNVKSEVNDSRMHVQPIFVYSAELLNGEEWLQIFTKVAPHLTSHWIKSVKSTS